MKLRKALTILALCAFALPAAALEKREFKNADGSKSFTAELIDYNAKKKRVTVRKKNGRKSTFPISLLSEEDKQYVIKNADVIRVARAVKVKFTEVKGKVTRDRGDLIRSRTTPTGYQITVSNSSNKKIENLEIHYSYYYCVGSSRPGGPKHTPKVEKGVLTYPKLFGKYSETRESTMIDLIQENKKPEGGG